MSSLTRNQSIARSMLFKLLRDLEQGCLRIHEQGELFQFGQQADHTDLVADIYVHDAQLYSDVIFGGSVGAGEAYMSGFWSTPNLTQVTRLFVRNIDALDAMDSKQSFIGQYLLKMFHWFNRNTKEGSRKNISAHYDLGNNFFRLFLDSTMMYSAAIYPTPDASLAEASVYKLKRICEKLQLTPNDHLLEIGTGWGGMAIYAAQHYGCRVTTTTISREQREYALARVAEAGLSDRITVLFDDYRDLRGQFSKLVSIEMIEAVGHEHYDQYFSTCSRLLAPNGLMLLQAITIADQRYDMARKTVDFIQRYIFPGGSLPSIAVISDFAKSKTDMNILHIEDIGAHYAQTLKHWREAFNAKLEAVREQDFDDRFIRMWEFYLCYCEGGFIERSIGTAQVLLAKPQYRSGYFQ
ncbi:cyclopropane-fatty-acyl-phospholipid synthase [Cellvibrio fibrivorans]|uniref:Cyclopropane-fatty-acyl-phospholipid synthase n=1 Tax=Cellvibrio fibrivorans TaxID=126350 RepID=A0ABU1UVW8_9GAMM|nr:cyclopropane-fatty-acyl-phospholipid synthase family protein [Cellvibrio fibrivorans]MDR7089339.1 cyclopropane-fatty-acyl-phospholipid synthase [Cellvibrio fibrivorans]